MEMKYGEVSLVTDLEDIVKELIPQRMWMVRPQFNRKYPNQRMALTAELVDLDTLNLAKMTTFEVL